MMIKSSKVPSLVILLYNLNWTFALEYDQEISTSEIFYYKPVPGGDQQSVKMLDISSFNSKQEIKVIIHGYIAHRFHPAIAPIKNAYLSRGYEAVFVADWEQAAAIQYLAGRYLINRVAIHLGRILETFLRKHNINPGNVHLLGHSLGAHLAGNIGRYFNGTIGRITGLDPAWPLFNERSKDDLRANQAYFVDIIHTGAQIQGDFTPRGHVDFYPNYGFVPQPGCKSLDLITLTSCSHYRAPMFYAESILIENNFPSVRCSLDLISKRKGENCFHVSDRNDIILMGENVPRRIRGTFLLETNNVPPYGLGFISRVYQSFPN